MTSTTRSIPSTAARTVLVVDDQPDVLEALRLVLKSAGYAPRLADSPESAINIASSVMPDLIVVDMNYASDTTSGDEGLALISRLKALKQNVPILAMTGWSTIELAVRAMQHGAADFITKPWDVPQLLALFEKHLQAGEKLRRTESEQTTELAIARRIQERLLPPRDVFAAGLQFTTAFLPAGEVGGDLYDVFELDSKHVAFLLADVSGKGLGAALLVAALQATIRGQLELAHDPSRLVGVVNRLFFHTTRPEHFATLFFGVFDRDSRTVRYVNCGHPPAVLMQKTGSMQLLAPTAMILGAFETGVFPEKTATLGPDDRLVLFSDGVSEAGIDNEEDWALETIRTFNRNRSQPLATSLATAAKSREEQADDITVIDIRAILN